MNKPPIHVILFGDPGSGKTTSAATFPKPMIVFQFDPFGKDTPYLKKGEVQDLENDDNGTPFREIYGKKSGTLTKRIEYYHDLDPKKPGAFRRFLTRMSQFHNEYDQWATVVIDSLTFMELCCRMNQKYHLNPTAKDGRQWYGGAKEDLEEMLMIRFAGFPMNVVINAHSSETKDEVNGTFIRGINAVGKLGKNLPGGYGELYRCYTGKGDDGFLWQTQKDSMWHAASQIGAPNPCFPDYKMLWAEK